AARPGGGAARIRGARAGWRRPYRRGRSPRAPPRAPAACRPAGPRRTRSSRFRLLPLPRLVRVHAVVLPAPLDREPERAPPGWEPGLELRTSVREAQPAEAEHRRLPEPAQRGGMHAAGGVPHVVRQVDLRGLAEVAHGER